MPNVLSDAVWCLSYFEVKKEYQDKLIQALLKLVEPTRAEPGCLQYELVIDNENPNFLIMVEKFISQERKPWMSMKNSLILNILLKMKWKNIVIKWPGMLARRSKNGNNDTLFN